MATGPVGAGAAVGAAARASDRTNWTNCNCLPRRHLPPHLLPLLLIQQRVPQVMAAVEEDTQLDQLRRLLML